MTEHVPDTAIKLVVSDFHLAHGRRLPDGTLNPYEDFIYDDRFVDFIEYYCTGDYTDSPVELIINGDFFNMIQIQVDGVVPKEITEAIACEQLEIILNGHSKVADALRNFHSLPGKELRFIVGNHDAGLLFDGVKQLLRERLGEVAIDNRSYEFDGVRVEHGDRYEPAHFVDPKHLFLSRGLREPILNIPLGTYFFVSYVQKMKDERPYVVKVKPFEHYLRWAAFHDTLFFLRTCFRFVFFFFHTMFFGVVGNQRMGSKAGKVFFRQMFTPFPLIKAAKRLLQTRPDLHTLIMGHTHTAMYRRFDAGKEYFNTGCWNDYTNLDIEGFGTSEFFTFAILERNEGRWRTDLQRWVGTHRPVQDVMV